MNIVIFIWKVELLIKVNVKILVITLNMEYKIVYVNNVHQISIKF